MLKIATVIGARPQFIKAATVTRAIIEKNRGGDAGELIREVIIHTGQHYDEKMSRLFFDELEIPEPDYNLGIGSDSHGRQTGRMLIEIEAALMEEKPDIVLTYGDTNSTIAGALAAVKLQIPSAHVEAGLRSYNRRMPEEINRTVTDEMSNILFCPTATAVENLRKEGIESAPFSGGNVLDFNHKLVLNTGDVMFDSMLFNQELARKKSDILAKAGLSAEKYCLATVHRQENTDDLKRLSDIFEALRTIASTGIGVLFPLHPRTKKCMAKMGLQVKLGPTGSRLNSGEGKGITFLEPVGYLDMIQLERHAHAVLTDSGGVQKEAFMLRVPCITLRDETEWVETVAWGWNILTGSDPGKIREAFLRLLDWDGQEPPFIRETSVGRWDVNEREMSPYGDGKAAVKIVRVLLDSFLGRLKENVS